MRTVNSNTCRISGLILTSLLLSAGLFRSYSQDWHWQNPLPQGNTLHSFFFTDPDVGWTVGNIGAILHTTDGATWSVQNSGTIDNLRSVWFTDEHTGWTVGNAGIVLHTTDGETWTSQTSGVIKILEAVTFTSPQSGWIAGDGGTMLHTTNGGTTWTPQTSGSTNHLHSLSFPDANNGWAVGLAGTIIHTTNGGANWTSQASGVAWDLNSVWFTDANNGWAAGLSDTILRTSDGGTNWIPQSSGTGQEFYAVSFTNPDTGWAAGLLGTIVQTTDGGATWAPENTGSEERLEAVFFADAENGWTAGTSGIILHTSDGGITWTPQTTGSRTARLSIVLADSLTGWTSGVSGTLLHTTDAGETWTSQKSKTSHSLRSLSFANTATGWVAGDLGTIERTTNGGGSWTIQPSGTSANLYAVSFTDLLIGWTAGDGGVILHTVNGGTTWTPQTSGTTENLRSLSYIDANRAWAVGSFGTILQTTNGGNTWTGQSPPTSSNLLRVCFADSATGWVTGESGTILHTTDGGLSWTSQTSGTTLPLSSVTFVDPNTGWITGGLGTILHTTDGGTSWIPQVSGTTQWLFSSSFPDAIRGWAVGQEGAIIHTPSGGSGRTPPVPPVLVAPEDSALASASPVLSWIPSPGARWYSLQVSRTSSFAVKLLNRSSITGTSFQMQNLDQDSTYYWRLSVTDDNNTSGWSAVRRFRIGYAPEQVVLAGPDDGSVVTADTVLASWHPANPEVDRYWIEWATDSLFAGSVVDSTVLDTTTVLTNLTHYRTYWWKVRAHNDVGWGTFSVPGSFLVYAKALPPPALVSPPDHAVNQPIAALQIVWQTVSPVQGPADTVRYHVQVSVYQGFDTLLVNDSTVIDTMMQLDNLGENVLYYWRVRASDLYSTSDWAAARDFRTLPPLPSQIVPLLPPDGATVAGDNVQFSWAAGDSGTDRYWFELATDSLFSSATGDTALTDTTTMARGLTDHIQYYWRVRGHNAHGWGEPGAVSRFLVLLNAPSAPVLLSPPDGTVNQLPATTFLWRTVVPILRRGASGSRPKAVDGNNRRSVMSDGPMDDVWYHLQVAGDALFQDLIVNDSTIVDSTAGGFSFDPGAIYYWRVRAIDIVGPGSWSDAWSFTMLNVADAPALLFPANAGTVADTTTDLIWQADPGPVDSYWLEWADNPDFITSTIDSTTTDTIGVAGPLANNQTYYWRVRGHNELGWGVFSEAWSFSVLVTGVRSDDPVPTVFSLSQNYPNPFNPTTVIRYGLPRESHVSLEVFSIDGKRVATLVDETEGAGAYRVTFSASGISSGVYLYRLRAGDFVETKKLLLMK